MPKFTWTESYTTICGYSAEITEEEAQLFKEDPERFFEEVSFRDNQDFEWDKITNEESFDFEVEE